VFLLYADAALAVLFGQIFSGFGLLLAVASAVAGYQIANEKRWGYKLGVAVAGLRVALLAFFILNNLGEATDLFFLVSMIFPVALFLALVHPISREYQRIWFE
jgi:lipopolysaccharide export LptBFGC system permease protein LptF